MLLLGLTAVAGEGGSPNGRLPAWAGYTAAVILEAAVTALLLVVHSKIPLGGFPVYYFLTIMLVAYHFGVGPAVLAFFLGLVAYDYFFIPPLGTPLPHAETAEGWAAIVAYVVGTTVVATATIMIRRSKRRVERIAELLRESEANYRELVENANSAIIRWKSDGTIVFFNEFAQRFFGYPEDEVIGRHIGILVPQTESTGADLSGLVRDILAHPERYTNNVNENVRKDGSRAWMTWTNKPIFGESGCVVEILAIGSDITERVRAEEAVRSQEELLSTFIEHTPAAVAMFDRDMRYLAVSRQWLKDYNLGDRSIIGLSHYEVFPEIEERWKEIHRRALAGATERCEEDPFPRADGTLDWVKWEIVPWRKADGSIGGITMFTEVITERKRAEEALRDAQEHQLDFYRRTIEAATGGKLVITGRSQIEELAGSPVATWDMLDREDLQAVRHGVENMAREAGMEEPLLGQLTVAVGEAATNAIKHAPSGVASLHKADDSLIVLVSDQGPGIPAISLPDVALRPGYSTAGTLGMGYKMMIQFADRVYLATGPDGTTVGIQIRLHPRETDPVAGMADSLQGD